jgi:hypothetical protein
MDPPNLLNDGYRGFFLIAKRPRRGVCHSTQSSAEIGNEWSYTFTSLCLHVKYIYVYIQYTHFYERQKQWYPSCTHKHTRTPLGGNYGETKQGL